MVLASTSHQPSAIDAVSDEFPIPDTVGRTDNFTGDENPVLERSRHENGPAMQTSAEIEIRLRVSSKHLSFVSKALKEMLEDSSKGNLAEAPALYDKDLNPWRNASDKLQDPVLLAEGRTRLATNV